MNFLGLKFTKHAESGGEEKDGQDCVALLPGPKEKCGHSGH